MKRLRDAFLEKITKVVPFKDKQVLEIGCGDGARTLQIAQLCTHVTGIDPDIQAIRSAQNLDINNAEFVRGFANILPFRNLTFDIAFFTLSFHHIAQQHLYTSIDEALRVIKSNGHIIFLEPAFKGSFFEAEIKFDAGDGDERKEKALAYATMLSHSGLKEIAELWDKTVFSFDSFEDFIDSMKPKQGTSEAMCAFLGTHARTLSAERRINIFIPLHTEQTQ